MQPFKIKIKISKLITKQKELLNLKL